MTLWAVLTISLLAADPVPVEVKPVKFSAKVDLPVTAGLIGAWSLSEFAFKKTLATPTCRWCEVNAFDRAFRNAFVPEPSTTEDGIKWADTASNVTAFGLVPLATLGLDALLAWKSGAELKDWAIDAVIILEATFAALAFNQLVKFTVARGRPFMQSLDAATAAGVRDPADNNLSFFSGHATFTMALAVATSTIAQQRGYKNAWVVNLVAVPLAISTGMLRMAADKHWFTDVLVGSLVGAAFGYGLPTLFHFTEDSPVSLRVVPGPGGVALSGRF